MNTHCGPSMFEGKKWHECAYAMIPEGAVMLRTFWHGQRLIAEAKKKGVELSTASALAAADGIVQTENENNYMLVPRPHWWHY